MLPKSGTKTNLWTWLTAPSSTLTDVGEQRSARLAASFLLIIGLLDLIGGIARSGRFGFVNAFWGDYGALMVLIFVAYGLAKTKWYRAAIFLFSVSFSAPAYIAIARQGSQADFGSLLLIYVPISLIVASSFISGWAVFLLTGLNVTVLLLLGALKYVELPDNIPAIVGILTTIGLVQIVLTNFRNNIEKIRLKEVQDINRQLEEARIGLEQRVNERTSELQARSEELELQSKELEAAKIRSEHRSIQFQALAEVSRAIASINELDKLLSMVTEVISQNFGFYHVGIFLTDEKNELAILRAANSEGGQRMLARNHQLQVGQTGIVSSVISSGKPRIALDTDIDTAFRKNPDLPETRSEMALPLLTGNRIIGVLDVQSTEQGAFSQEDVKVLTTLADQVSIAIQNAQSFEKMKRSVAENQALIQLMSSNLWKRAAQEQNKIGYRYLGRIEELTNAVDMQQGKGVLQIPIAVRGTVIGTINVRPPAQKSFSPDEEDIIRAATERAAIAAENARLLEDSQRRATKEQTIGEITSKIGASINMRNVLQTAVEELGRAMPGSEILIQFQGQE